MDGAVDGEIDAGTGQHGFFGDTFHSLANRPILLDPRTSVFRQNHMATEVYGD